MTEFITCKECDRNNLTSSDFYVRENGNLRKDCKFCFIERKKRNYAKRAPERCLLQQEYYRKNSKYCKQWAQVNLADNRAKNLRLRSDLTLEQWYARLEEFEYTCAYCLNPNDSLAIEHFRPLSRGGENTLDNVVPSCKRCNSRKHNHLVFDWIPSFAKAGVP